MAGGGFSELKIDPIVVSAVMTIMMPVHLTHEVPGGDLAAFQYRFPRHCCVGGRISVPRSLAPEVLWAVALSLDPCDAPYAAAIGLRFCKEELR